MPLPMGRRRSADFDLPPLMQRRVRGGSVRYYYGRAGIALGGDFALALRKYAELHAGTFVDATFADAARLYLRDELPKRAPKTQTEYGRQVATLVKAFGRVALPDIRPADVRQYMRERGDNIAATREKAVLSLVFNYARTADLTTAPNPCAGIRGRKAKRDRYVEDGELAAAMACPDAILAGFLELAYLTGQRPSDVLRMTRADVKDGALWVRQAKTGAKVRIAIVGPLAGLLDRLLAGPVASLYLVRDERGQPFTLRRMRARFRALGLDWQVRDLRAKAASDMDTAQGAQRLLGHAAASTTDGYIRQRAGASASPVLRKVGK